MIPIKSTCKSRLQLLPLHLCVCGYAVWGAPHVAWSQEAVSTQQAKDAAVAGFTAQYKGADHAEDATQTTMSTRLASTTREAFLYPSPTVAPTRLYVEEFTKVMVNDTVVAGGKRWAKVVGAGHDYFINEAALEFSGEELKVSYRSSGSPGLQLVAAARRFLGVPYVWGAVSKTRVDSSGLVLLSLREIGYEGLPRVARDQYRVGVPVAIKDLQPGDRLYFSASGTRIDHTGIYSGNGRIIEANGGFGRVVERNLFSSSMFRKYYSGARRGFGKPISGVASSLARENGDNPKFRFFSTFAAPFVAAPLLKPTPQEIAKMKLLEQQRERAQQEEQQKLEARRLQLVAFAQRDFHAHYRAKGHDLRGFDSAQWVQRVMKEAGEEFPQSLWAQFDKQRGSSSVSRETKPGHLIFFLDKEGVPTSVGIIVEAYGSKAQYITLRRPQRRLVAVWTSVLPQNFQEWETPPVAVYDPLPGQVGE